MYYISSARSTRTVGAQLRWPPLARSVLVLGISLAGRGAAQGQDLYFAQPYATRMHTNPAFTGLFDDYSITLSYRNQFPTLAGTFQTTQLAADYRFKDQTSAVGLLLNLDRTGAIGYTRIEAGGTYAYHARLTPQLSFSGGAQVSYGNQRISYSNLVFGDQIDADGSVQGGTRETLDYNPVSYLTLGTGVLLYSDRFWLSLASHHLNQPDLGFRSQTQLPLRLNLTGGYKHFFVRNTTKQQYREISLSPTVSYTRQGSSQRAEAGVYAVLTPITLGLMYRGVPLPGSSSPQKILTATAGVSFGAFRLGYSYDASLSSLSADLGGAHELSLGLRNFDSLEAAWRRLKRRNYPSIPCPAF
ncbi:PorP/SprF family type IX secretion system membrane protein [Hymenobacter sp. BT635]|uniref:PorP/SprF family type IX secretion system membrane protein n=1 Tax=Hymenobacter nitidus TaxID=2880929 RepID=A0ABS8ADU5_9BACT|nr:PorP/SprF family type IX secretion system membrane protein [Hymenobacter nitidus]MCB2378588.1 PorP/SprF family type IX secretion system membrane protein [Hymenobacter nitidus]